MSLIIRTIERLVANGESVAASNGGTSDSGDADGGDVAKRAYDADTAGGNGHSGNTSDVNGGSVTNVADEDGNLSNDASSEPLQIGRAHV